MKAIRTTRIRTTTRITTRTTTKTTIRTTETRIRTRTITVPQTTTKTITTIHRMTINQSQHEAAGIAMPAVLYCDRHDDDN
ncbi:MAG: hypothetical protein GX567_14190 [Clostridia bacterium]|nr:hypothetical protein [Clostridia bacterium]